MSLLLTVKGMDCQHCVETVTNAVNGVPGAQDTAVDLESGQVSVQGEVARDAVVKAIEAKGYEVAA